MLHHNLSRKAAQSMLDNWKTCQWSNDIISTDVHLGNSRSYFPSPDATFTDPTNKLTVTMEFKPPNTSKRDILTGLGQAISYLGFSSISYLVIPKMVESFPVGEYLKDIFEDKKLNDVIPVGLIVYDNEDPSNIKIFKDVKSDMTLEQIYDNRTKGRYWAPYKDSNPHTIWLLLEIAYLLKNKEDRKLKIWDEFFDKYYCPIHKRYNDEYCITDIEHWDTGKLVGFAERFKEIKEMYAQGLIDENNLKEQIDNIIGKNKPGDSLYKSYRKNRLPFLSNLGLWDEQYYLTDIGYELHKIGKVYGPNSRTFRDRLCKIILIEGSHLDLILDIENNTRNKEFETVGEAKKQVSDYLEDRGLINRNPNRSPNPEDAKDDFMSEFQLWGKLDLVKKIGGQYYTSNKGFNFSWDEITRIILQ